MKNTNQRIEEIEKNINENKNRIKVLTAKIEELKRNRPSFEAGLLTQ